MKHLASTVKRLQEEISGVNKDKEGTVNTPCWKNKCSHDDEDIGKVEGDFETHYTCNGKSSEDDSSPSDAEGKTPWCTHVHSIN